MIEISKWGLIAITTYCVFITGLLFYVVRLRYYERLKMAKKPNTSNAPTNNKNNNNPIKCGAGNKRAQ